MTSSPGYTAFTPMSQTGPSGTGTASSPFTVTTTVALGDTGIRLTQVDSYQIGQDSYRTVITLSGARSPARVYLGGDCYLQDSDYGRGAVLQGTAPVCKALPTSANPERVEGFLPLTDGSSYIQGSFDRSWPQRHCSWLCSVAGSSPSDRGRRGATDAALITPGEQARPVRRRGRPAPRRRG